MPKRGHGVFGFPITGKTALIILASFAVGGVWGYLTAQG